MADPLDALDCRSCGACCAHSADWPRFSTETDAALDSLPPELVSEDLSGMRCVGNRCAALLGRVGVDTRCSIYDLRPDVCRACVPGGDDCRIARVARGLSGSPSPRDDSTGASILAR